MIDVCFPDKNEEEFIKIAKQLGLSGLCFIYEHNPPKFKKTDLKIYTALLVKGQYQKHLFAFTKLTKNISKNKYLHYLFSCKELKSSFHTPFKEITQVLMKDLHKQNKLVGVSFKELYNNPLYFEKTAFFVKLCNKYKVNVFLASFATSPYELLSDSALKSLSKKTGILNNNVLENYLIF